MRAWSDQAVGWLSSEQKRGFRERLAVDSCADVPCLGLPLIPNDQVPLPFAVALDAAPELGAERLQVSGALLRLLDGQRTLLQPALAKVVDDAPVRGPRLPLPTTPDWSDLSQRTS